MGREQQAIQIVLSGIVGIGFVTPMATALFRMAGLDRSPAILGGTLVGVAVAAYVYPRMKRTRE